MDERVGPDDAYRELPQQVDAERGAARRFSSFDDAFAIVGAVVELASRHLRKRRTEDIRELEPVIERVALGLVGFPPA